MAFTDYETEQLHKALLKETRRCAVTLGMKKTSVDQLTKAVGIAKGSFYKFYESKEMAFFAVLESIHSELYGVADQALHRNGGLPTSGRAAKAVLAVCRRLSDKDGSIVLHKAFGEGTVTKIDKAQKHIRVTFGIGEKTFIFPDAFKQGFLKMKGE